jgi:hypothetical protein
MKEMEKDSSRLRFLRKSQEMAFPPPQPLIGKIGKNATQKKE